LFFDSFIYHLKSALSEDLVFRGILLYILIKKIGIQKGGVLSAITFGIYHWFSYKMINGPIIPLI
jgi:membrane protease YdiL (CAAX protease family)